MGVDEAVLASGARGGPPALGFYAWQRPTLSLGFAQTLAGERRAACAARGVEVVRRSTGGGAVLHGSDLTYSVTAPATDLPGDVVACYALLAAGLVEGLRTLGVEARCVARGAQTARADFDCFARAGAGEIVAAGAKLCGSAQRRGRGGLLQHGSLRLRPDPPGAGGGRGGGRGGGSRSSRGPPRRPRWRGPSPGRSPGRSGRASSPTSSSPGS